MKGDVPPFSTPQIIATRPGSPQFSAAALLLPTCFGLNQFGPNILSRSDYSQLAPSLPWKFATLERLGASGRLCPLGLRFAAAFQQPQFCISCVSEARRRGPEKRGSVDRCGESVQAEMAEEPTAQSGVEGEARPTPRVRQAGKRDSAIRAGRVIVGF